MYVKILEENIDREAIFSEVEFILKHLKMDWKAVDQIGLQGHNPGLNPIAFWNKHAEYPETYYKYPLWNTPIINSFVNKYGLVRTRIVKSNPGTCTTLQRRMSKHVYIPLISNKNCFTVINNQVYHMKRNHSYIVESTEPHSDVNASVKSSVHIVGCLY